MRAATDDSPWRTGDSGEYRLIDEPPTVVVDRRCRLARVEFAPDGRPGSMRLLNGMRGRRGIRYEEGHENRRDKNDLNRGDHQTGDHQSTTAFPTVSDLVQRDQPE